MIFKKCNDGNYRAFFKVEMGFQATELCELMDRVIAFDGFATDRAIQDALYYCLDSGVESWLQDHSEDTENDRTENYKAYARVEAALQKAIAKAEGK